MLSISQTLIQDNEVNDVLKEWRTRAVTIILYVITVVALPALVATAITQVKMGYWLSLGLISAIYLALVLLALLRKLDYRLRGCILLAAGYFMAVINLMNVGLEGSGRVYLLAMPVFGFILIGVRTGWITTALSTLIYAAFVAFSYTGQLDSWLAPITYRLDESQWIIAGITMMMLLILIIALLMRMYGFLLNILRDERRVSSELAQSYDKTLEGWARALELRDIETAGHCQRVSEITRRLAGKASVTNGDMTDLHRGALLHDIGKMGIPDSILLKPGKLTGEEFKQMQYHTTYAYELLSHIPYLLKALDIPYCHHEKWDGTGYPRGLKGTEIPLSARVFSVVDVYDALISDRPYRPAWPEEKALAYIKERAGTEFDPAVVDAFVELANEELDSFRES